MVAAGQFAKDLPKFEGLAQAERVLLAARDRGLVELRNGADLALDFTAESLDTLERWFFESGQPKTIASGYSAAHAVGFYFGETLCRAAGFHWVVEEFPFSPGRFEIGVSRGLATVMLTKGLLPEAQNNQRMRSLSRAFKRYAA